MKKVLSLLVLFVSLGIFSSKSFAVEADKVIFAKDFAQSALVQDAMAFGGSYVRQGHPWSPIVKVPAPSADGDYTLWVRYRKGYICAKTVNGDAQKDLAWVWGKPQAWTWAKVGQVNKNAMRDGILIIRDGGTTDSPEIDAIAYLTNKVNEPKNIPNYSEPQLATVDVSINWNDSVREIDPRSYSLNLFKSVHLKSVSNPAYRLNLQYMSPKLVRIHSAEMMIPSSEGCWFDMKNSTWDADKIGKIFKNLRVGEAEKLVTICSFPPWMKLDEHGRLDKSEYANYAKFCAELVKIINVDNNADVKYFEITNEKDVEYWVNPVAKNTATKIEDLAELYNMCAVAMKEVDSSIKTGGPASARSDKLAEQKKFAQLTLDNLDFFSYHIYASGSAKDSNEHILYTRTKAFGEYAKKLTEIMNSISPNKKIETFLNEYNISWTWDVRDVRMTNSVGALFHALVMVEAIKGGVSGANAWNECDGIYGAMDGNYSLRPAAHLFHLLNKYGNGDMVNGKTTSDDIVVLAVTDGDKKMLMVINRSGNARNIKIDNIIQGDIKYYQINSNEFVSVLDTKMADTYKLPQESITFFIAE